MYKGEPEGIETFEYTIPMLKYFDNGYSYIEYIKRLKSADRVIDFFIEYCDYTLLRIENISFHHLN